MEINQNRAATGLREGGYEDVQGDSMQIEFADPELRRLAEATAYVGSWDTVVAKAYRRRLQQILAAVDERDLRFPGGNRFEKLQGARNHQHSMRINDQWRLILEIRREGVKTVVKVMGIEDYH